MKLCLVTEGTYPYHVGGVSTWTHTLLNSLSDVDVTLVSLYAGDAPGAPAWTLPPSVSALRSIQVPDSLAPADLRSWCRTAVAEIPETDLVHVLTAGVAGLLGRALKAARGTPLLVTEHGIGWHELQHGAGETETGFRPDTAPCGAQQALAQAVRDLRHHARTTYEAADRITTVAWSNQEKQLALGADPSRSQVIPNGVAVPAPLPAPPSAPEVHVGFVGRVTPLKDVHTFLRACALVQTALSETKFTVVGPPADTAYAAQCHALAHTLGLTDRLTFVEHAREMAGWYDRFDVMALTSRSEAQPLAVLEAMAHARPVVVTDVGDCHRLVTGPDDAFGPAGRVCLPGDAEAVGEALLSLARSPQLRRTLGQAGWRRVRAAHRRESVTTAYRRLYTTLVSTA